MRRRQKDKGDSMTLFPFLAVLICTMGSLIVLLVIIMQQAKATAEDVTRKSRESRDASQAQHDEQTAQVTQQLEDVTWRIDLLEQSRVETVEQLDRRRDELAYLEDEIRQMRDKLERTAQEADQIRALAASDESAHADPETQIAKLKQKLDEATEGLEQARKDAENREPSYALVAYDGSSGTRRRPIYIECRGDRILLQPEEILLTGEDFREPLTDDNALASALRAQREYLNDAAGSQQEPPYPLIVVRPDGAQAYAAARAAMKSWDSEFGYELVDESLDLTYPKRDEALAKVTRDAVEEARARRRLLQQIAPARFGRQDQPLLTPSRNGGFASTGGDRRSGRGPGGDQPQVARSASSQGGRFDSGAGPGGAGNGVVDGENRFASSGNGNATTDDPFDPMAFGGDSADGYGGLGGGRIGGGPGGGAADGPFANGLASGNGNNRATGGGTGPSQSQGPSTTNGGAESQADARSARDAGLQFANPVQGDGFAAGATGGNGNRRIDSSVADSGGSRGPNGPQHSGATAAMQSAGRGTEHDGKSGAGGSRGSLASAGGASGGGNGAGSTGAAGRGASGGSSAQAGQPGAAGMSAMMGAPNVAPLSGARGRNWALPGRGVGSTGITRPINIDCFDDRLVVVPENRYRAEALELPVGESLQPQIDTLVIEVAKRMEAWGIAGNNMYWKPVLQVDVDAGAEYRYAELAALLRESGIVVLRK